MEAFIIKRFSCWLVSTLSLLLWYWLIYFARHEHLYDRISSYVIRSDEYSTASRELQDCQVILCTLSTLAHPRLSIFTRKVPIKTMVIDEASQINVNDYIPILERFSSLHKLCFIGDDKQCMYNLLSIKFKFTY